MRRIIPTVKILIAAVLFSQLLFFETSYAQTASSQPSVEQVEKNPFEDPKELYNYLIDKTPEKKNAALSYIQSERPKELIPFLKTGILAYKKTILFNRIYDYRAVCLEALRLYPTRDTINDWIELLSKTGSAMLKLEIMDQISSIIHRNMVMPLTDELKNPFFDVRQSAAKLLRSNGDDRVYPVLLSMMTDSSPVIRVYAIEALTYLYDPRFNSYLMNMFYDSDSVVRIHAIRCVRKNNIVTAASTVRNLASSDVNGHVRFAAFTYMMQTGDRSVINIAIRSINDSDRITRLSSVNVINSLNAVSGFAPLCYRLQSESDDEIKEAILDTLIARGNVPYAGSIVTILRSDADVNLRRKAAHALSFRKDTSSMQALIHTLGDDKEQIVRAEACGSLANYQSVQATRALLSAAGKNETRYVRTAALYAIIKSKTRNATVGLFEIFAEEDDPVFRSILYGAVHQLIAKYH